MNFFIIILLFHELYDNMILYEILLIKYLQITDIGKIKVAI